MKNRKEYDEDDTLDMELLDEAWRKENARSGRFAPANPGDFNIRILPPTQRGLYYKRFGLHYDVILIAAGTPADRKAVACLKETLEQDCPVCQAVAGMWAEAQIGEVEDRTTISLASKCKCRIRYVMNIVDMDNPKAGVMTWEVPKSTMDMIQPLFKRWGNIVHPTDGQVLAVTYSKKDKWNIVTNVQPTNDKSEIPVKDWRAKRRDFEEYVRNYVVPADSLRTWLKAGRRVATPVATQHELEFPARPATSARPHVTDWESTSTSDDDVLNTDKILDPEFDDS